MGKGKSGTVAIETSVGLFRKVVDDEAEQKTGKGPWKSEELMERFKTLVFPDEMAFNGKDVMVISLGNKRYVAASVWEKGGTVYHWAYLFLTVGQLKKLKDILNGID